MDINELVKKEKTIENCIATLKKEFVGIDNIIDQVMDNIRSWYMFPNLMERPLVINLWGMTGCGKTSLVNRICELLDIRSNTIYYNLAKLGEENSVDIEDSFSSNLGFMNKNAVFVFDEFQFAASIDSTGKEKEIKTSLKTIWEIIDTGKIIREVSKYTKSSFGRILRCMEMIEGYGAVVENSIWVNSKECFDKMSVDQRSEVLLYFNVNFDVPETYRDAVPSRYWLDNMSLSVINDRECFATCEVCGLLYDNIVYFETTDDINYSDFVKKLKKMSFGELYDYITKVYKKISNGQHLDYSKSLVFVMGNIDEAYTISYNFDPDMDPDQFRAITEKLTTVDIKDALRERFRNEQIARLGNIMMIYPSFSKKNFEDIININLESYAKSVKKEMGIEMEFDDSIKRMIYNDGVFPTQGTRPVFTAIYEIVKTKLAQIVTSCVKINNESINNISSIYLCSKGEKVKAVVKNGDAVLFEMEYNQELRIDKLRNVDKKEQQSLTAVHESGHFVIYSKTTGKLPAKLMSVTASNTSNGFMIPDEDDDNFMSKQDYINSIKTDLAGYAAEMMVFGADNMTSGACEDLRRATETASRMVREYGMGSLYDIAVTTYLKESSFTDGGNIILDTENELESVNKKILSLLRDCVQQVQATLSEGEWHDMFVKSCRYLKDNSIMPKEIMKEFYESVPENIRKTCARQQNFFATSLNKYIGE